MVVPLAGEVSTPHSAERLDAVREAHRSAAREGSAPPRLSSRTKEKKDIVEQLDVDLCDRRPGVFGHVGERLGHDESRRRPRVAPGAASEQDAASTLKAGSSPPSERIA
jgi:hypothetical protein